MPRCNIVVVTIEAPIEFKPLLRRERQGILVGRDAVPQVFNQADALVDAQMFEVGVHVLSIPRPPGFWKLHGGEGSDVGFRGRTRTSH